jgi:hypothetical protein
MSNNPQKTNRLYKIIIATVAIFMIVSMIAAAIR